MGRFWGFQGLSLNQPGCGTMEQQPGWQGWCAGRKMFCEIWEGKSSWAETAEGLDFAIFCISPVWSPQERRESGQSPGSSGLWGKQNEGCLFWDRIHTAGHSSSFFPPPLFLLFFAAAQEDSASLFNYSSWENSKLFPSMNYLHSWENRFLSNISGILPFAHRGECCRDLSWQVCWTSS